MTGTTAGTVRLVKELLYRETIAGPWGPTADSPLGPRMCWSVLGAGRVAGPHEIESDVYRVE